jgi:hypothetical protein
LPKSKLKKKDLLEKRPRGKKSKGRRERLKSKLDLKQRGKRQRLKLKD